MKAYPKKDLQEGMQVEISGHLDTVVDSMLEKGLMNLEPYRNFDGDVIPEWYTEITLYGYNWHISWLDVIDEH